MAWEILQLEDSYQMCTQSKYYSNLIRIASAPKKQVLSDIVLETLSIIAYRQPVTKLEIEKIRGVKSDHAVNRLWNTTWFMRQAVWMAPGRPALFATTEEFMAPLRHWYLKRSSKYGSGTGRRDPDSSGRRT